jgi:signal peptidase II
MLLVSCVGCDLKTKNLARSHLSGGDAISFLADTVRLDYAENQGAFLGLGASLPDAWRAAVFTIGCSAVIAVLLAYALIAARIGYSEVLGLSLICAGGLGNVIDRAMYGYSRDFLNVGLGPIRTGIFNVADVALMTGCLVYLWSQRNRTRQKPCSNAESPRR